LIVLGGSAAFCYQGGGEAKSWPGLLSSYLSQELKAPVEVLNLSAPGYDLSNSKVNYLFTGRSLNPHVVLVYHTWNDFKFLRGVDAGDPPIFARTVSNVPLWKKLARN